MGAPPDSANSLVASLDLGCMQRPATREERELASFLEWWNLVYVVPLGFGFLLLSLQLAGLGGDALELDTDLDADLALEADVHVEADLDGDVELDADASADADGAGDVDVELAPGGAPLTVNLMNLCFTWGAFGLAGNHALLPVVGRPEVVLVVTAITSGGVTVVLNRLIGRYLPTLSTFSTRPVELVGRVGRSVYSLRGDREGTARVEDRHGNLQQVSVFLGDGEPDVVADQPVLLTRYDEERAAYEAATIPPELVA